MATDRRLAAAPYSPQLDGLRAVAVAAVAWSHWLPAWQFGVPLGAGVHLFFVLSGFLITRILLGLRAAPDRPAALGRFYARRALRLFPAFYVVIGAVWLADVPLVRDTWPWHAAYLSNVYIAGQAAWQGHVSHFWSLAVEEQFYLLWPWLVVWTPTAMLGPVIAITTVAGPASHMAAAWFGLSEPFWALVPGGSGDSLGVGAWIAWRHWRAAPGSATTARRGLVAGASGWAALLVWGTTAPLPMWVGAWRQVLQGLVFAWIVERAASGFGGRMGVVLAHPGVVAVGRISYGIYLLHAFAPLVLDALLRAANVDPRGLAAGTRAAAAAVLTLGLAAVLWRVVERPSHRLKARLGSAA